MSNNKLPSVTSDIPRDLRTFIDRLREIVTGSGSSKIVTVGDLVSAGVATTTPSGALVPAKDNTIASPITPSNVQAEGAIQNIIITWDAPLYKGHAYAEIWGGSVDNVGSAVLIGMSPGVTFVDSVGPGVVRYYWVRFVNQKNVIGAFNAVAGTRGETGPEVQHLLDVLTGQITSSQLYADLGARINLIDGSGPGSVNARIAVETQNRTTADSAIAGIVTTLSTTVDGHTTSIQTVAETTDGLGGKYTVKIDNNGYVAGYGLASVANNGAVVADFAVRADKFYIASPTGPGITPTMPFIVQTTPQTINGELVPVGVYITDAFIRNGTITSAKIANATIDSAKIASLAASKLTAGSISTDEYIQSSNFIAGSQGWKIFGNGAAEFAAASIRGQLTASQIDSRGLSIKDANGNIILAAGTALSTSYISGLGSLATASSVSYSDISGSKPPADATRNVVYSSPNMPVIGIKEGDVWQDTSTTQSKTWIYLSNAWRLSGTVGATFSAGAGQISGQITSANVSTFIANAAITNAQIENLSASKIQAGNIAVNQYIRSSNYAAGSAGWNIDGNGNAEFNGLTVRSGQVTGALLKAVKVNAYSGIYIQINSGTPISTTNGPYYLNGGGMPQYLVGYFTMPAPETAAHKIAAIINVQAIAGGQNKDLAVLLVVGTVSGNNIYGEQIAYNTNSGVYGIATNASGTTAGTYDAAATVGVFVGGNNASFTIQTIDGLIFGVR